MAGLLNNFLTPLEKAIFFSRFLPVRRVLPAYRRFGAFLLKNLFAPRPYGAFFALTYRCNLACGHCFMGDYRPEGEELSTAELKAFLDFLAGWGPFAAFFSGGEPLLRPDLAELVDHASSLGLLVSVETNGLLLGPAKVSELRKAGIHNIRVSVDGADEAAHDPFRRRPGAFRAATAALEECVRQGVRCLLVTTASAERLRSGDLARTVELGRRLGVDGVKLLAPKRAGRWKAEPGALLSPEEKRRLEGLLDPSFVYPEQLKGTECYTRGRKYFCVNPYGEVQPCPSIPISYGSIRETAPEQVLARLMAEDFSAHGECGSCVSADPAFHEKLAALAGRKLPVRVDELKGLCGFLRGGR